MTQKDKLSTLKPKATTQSDSQLANYSFGFRSDNFDVYGWVRNVFDVNYFELLQVAPGNVGLIAGQPGDPRTVGGTVKFSF